MKKVVLFLLLMLFLIPIYSQTKTFDERVNIHGGITRTKRMSLWEIERYRDTKLLRKHPLCYAPWKAYLAVCYNTEVKDIGNYNCLVIKDDLVKKVSADARYNRNFAKKFKGRSFYRIYYWLLATEYTKGKKTAREVFTERKGDCAGITAALYVICKVNHIPVRYVIGWNRDGCHAWNRVKWNGKWYWVDIAYDKYLSKKLWKGYSIMEKW